MIKGVKTRNSDPKMQDVYLPIAHALARPLQTPRGASLYQLWRADFAALARLARTCREASMAVRRLLWHCTKLGERERARRAQVEPFPIGIGTQAPDNSCTSPSNQSFAMHSQR
jgi:hypothetical protein